MYSSSIRKKEVTFNKHDVLKSVSLNWDRNPPFISNSQGFHIFCSNYDSSQDDWLTEKNICLKVDFLTLVSAIYQTLLPLNKGPFLWGLPQMLQ